MRTRIRKAKIMIFKLYEIARFVCVILGMGATAMTIWAILVVFLV